MVRFILLSISISWTWFRTEAPAARQMMPVRGMNQKRGNEPELMTAAARAENVTAMDTLKRVSWTRSAIEMIISGFLGTRLFF
jgi:hypothetical protein